MRLIVVTKSDLSPEQAVYLDRRIAAPEHATDNGPSRVWHVYSSHLYAFVHIERQLPIAVAEASGRPTSSPGWWIDLEFRGQGYGNELVDLLAWQLKSEGVTAIGHIKIDSHLGKYDTQSKKLADRMRAHFAPISS